MLAEQIKTLNVKEENTFKEIKELEVSLKNKKNEINVIKKAKKHLEKLQEQLGLEEDEQIIISHQ